MFAHEFLIQDNFPYHDVITLLKDETMQVDVTIQELLFISYLHHRC
jgi:hypothetical protein